MSVYITNNGSSSSTTTTFADELYNQFLLCPLCSDIYRQPKILSCQHSFCADCIESHYEMDESERPYRFLMSYSRDLSCPVCRARTPLPNGGVRRLPDNFLVANLTDVISRRTPSTLHHGAPMCDICSRAPTARRASSDSNLTSSSLSYGGGSRPAAVKCLDCVKMLCEECAERHRTTKVTATHGLFTISVEHDVECKTHRGETLRFYCEPCQTCVCVLCTFHDHKEHDVTSLQDGLQRHRGSFAQLLDNCRHRIDTVRGQLRLIESCETGLRLAEDHIRDAAIESIAAVRRREKQLVAELRQAIGEKTFEFIADRKLLEDQLAGLEGAFKLTETMMHGTSVELLMLKKEMLGKLNAVLEPEVRPTPEGLRRTVQLLPDNCFSNVDKSELFNVGDVAQANGSVQRDDDSHVNAGVQTDGSKTRSVNTSTAEDSVVVGEVASTQTATVDFDSRPVIRPVISTPSINHVELTLVDEIVTDPLTDVMTPLPSGAAAAAAAAEKNGNRREQRRSSVQGRWPLEKSNSFTGDAPPSPTVASTPRNIPNFSRLKPPAAVLVDRSTEMEPIVSVEATTWTTRTTTCEKETSTAHVIQLHKNVSTENQAMVDKGTSTISDVTAAYRNMTTTKRTITVSRGTSTVAHPTTTTTTVDRASSPVRLLATPIVLTSSGLSKIIPASPTLPRQILVTSSAAGQVSIRTAEKPAATNTTTTVPQSTPSASATATVAPTSTMPQQMPGGLTSVTSQPTQATSGSAKSVSTASMCRQT